MEERQPARLRPSPSNRDATLNYNTGPAAGGRVGGAFFVATVGRSCPRRFSASSSGTSSSAELRCTDSAAGRGCVCVPPESVSSEAPPQRSFRCASVQESPRVCSRLASWMTVPSSSPPPHRHPRQVFEREYNHADEKKGGGALPNRGVSEQASGTVRRQQSPAPLCRCQREPSTGLSSTTTTTTSQGGINRHTCFRFLYFFSFRCPCTLAPPRAGRDS